MDDMDDGYRIAEVDDQDCRNLIAAILIQLMKDCVFYQSPPNPFLIKRRNGRKATIDEDSRPYIAWVARDYIRIKNSEFRWYCDLLDIDIDVLCEKVERTIIYFDLGLVNEFTKKINSLYKSSEILSFYIKNLLQLIENCVEKTESVE